MIDPDKKLARPANTEPERVPWAVRDARITHGIDLVWRGMLGVVAGLLGAIFFFAALKAAPDVPAKGDFHRGAALSYYLAAVVGAGMLAFAWGQVLQLCFVGGDQGYDQRLWARMSSRERGLWRLRETGSGRMTFRLFVALSLGATLYLDAFFARVLWRDALAGDWLPGAGALAISAAAVALAVFAFRPKFRPTGSEQGSSWVSEGRWVTDLRRNAFVEPLLFLGVGGAAATFSAFVLWFKPGDDEMTGMAVSGAVLGLAGAWQLYGAVKGKRGRPFRIEIVRQTDKPLVLACKVTLPLSPEEVAAGDWLARFAAYRGYRNLTLYTDKAYLRWIDVTAAAAAIKGTSDVTFTFRIDVPRDMPYQPPLWVVRLESRAGRREPYEFYLPQQIVFTEEYPAA
jgi:hypothetical protein